MAIADAAKEPPVSDTIVLEDVVVDESYTGVRMEKDNTDAYFVTATFVKSMMEGFEGGKALHRRFALTILLAFQRLVKALPSLVDVDVPAGQKVTICGDTHGQYFDLLHIFKLNGLPSLSNPYVFNGDFVDRGAHLPGTQASGLISLIDTKHPFSVCSMAHRYTKIHTAFMQLIAAGSWSVEVILTLMAWKVVHPDSVHLIRGNHEAQSLNRIYGFEGEVISKYSIAVMAIFRCASAHHLAPSCTVPCI